MLEFIVELLRTFPWYWILIIAFSVTFIENIFPPAPCDSILAFCGTLVGIGAIGFFPLLIASTIGSVAGFVVMYWLGWEFGVKIVDSDRIKFINHKSLEKPEEWFRKHGYLLIVVNRFLSGTRAVISFFAGMSKLHRAKTVLYSFLSALFWNAILIGLGSLFAENWQLVDYYMSLYGKILTPIIAAIVLFFVIRWLILRKKKK